jgi:hypothetical protein
MADYLNFLGQCVRATEESVTTLEACITNLHPGVDDLPRLSKVLANEHVSSCPLLPQVSFITNQCEPQLYLLLPDPLLQEYKTELADSLKPQINTLVERAEEVIQRDEKKMKSLEERVRLPSFPSIPPS